MSIKKYDIAGTGPNLQLGKKGGHLNYTTTADNGSGGTQAAIQFLDTAQTNLLRVQIGAPIAPMDAVRLIDLSNYIQGLDTKQSVMAASAPGQNIALSGTLAGTMLDDVQLQANWRVLLKDQTDQRQNGVYRVSVSGANYTLIRTDDANNVDIQNNPSAEVSGGMYVFVEKGTANASTGWVLSSPQGTAILGTDNLIFTQFSSAGVTQAGAALAKNGVVLDVVTDNTTVHVNGSNQLSVKSSNVVGELLVSKGTGDAGWGTVNLGSPNAVGTSVLLATNGGTGINNYTYGDILVGGSTTNTLSKLAKGSNMQFLGIDSNGLVNYNYVMTLRDSTGQAVVRTSGVTNSTNTLTVGSSAGTDPVSISTSGNAGANVNLVLSPQNNGLVVARTGYDSYLQANRFTVSNEAFVTKGYTDYRVDSIDTTKIQNPATTTYFATNQSGYTNKAIVASNNKVMAEFVGAAAGTADSGERLQITHISNEVQLKAINTTGTGNVDLRLFPQAQGQVYFGGTGDGLIQGELGYGLTVKGGNSVGTSPGGPLYLQGGNGTQGNNNGGAVYITPGAKNGTGVPGTTVVRDHNVNKLVEFLSPTTGVAGNWLEISNALVDNDSINNSPKIQVANASGAADVGIVFGVKGSALLKVNDGTTYLASLQVTGNTDALVTKAYVNSRISDTTLTAGAGLTNTNNVLTVNVGASTIKLDTSNNLIVNSSVVANQVLISGGIAGQEATWGAIPLNNTNAVTGVLAAPNGGTGIATYQPNDILIGNSGNTLSKLSKGSSNSFLGINGTTGNLAYMYLSTLRDTNGVKVADTIGTAGAENYLVFKNSIIDSAPTITVGGSNTNMDIIIAPLGTGLIAVRSGYTTDLKALTSAQREYVATKGYVDDALQTNVDGMMRQVHITSGWAASMNIGLPTPNYFGRSVYISRVVLRVDLPVTGGLVTQAKVMAGSNQVMSMDENDIQVVDTYIADTPMNFASTNTQLTIQFFQADGSTTGVPTAGDITVSVEYKII